MQYKLLFIYFISLAVITFFSALIRKNILSKLDKIDKILEELLL